MDRWMFPLELSGVVPAVCDAEAGESSSPEQPIGSQLRFATGREPDDERDIAAGTGAPGSLE
ncbi:MAG TPA: hypothetical protein VF193_08865 [Steroidobacter sp.]